MGRNYLDVYNHNILNSRILRRLLERLGLRKEDSKDLLLYSDATYKYDVYVEGQVKGSVSADILVEQAQDFKVHKDLVVQDDATVKDDIYVEDKRAGGLGIVRGVTTDFTSGIKKFTVVSGLIVDVKDLVS